MIFKRFDRIGKILIMVIKKNSINLNIYNMIEILYIKFLLKHKIFIKIEIQTFKVEFHKKSGL